MAFSHIQDSAIATGSVLSTLNVALASAVNQGDVVVVGVAYFKAAGTFNMSTPASNCVDQAANQFTLAFDQTGGAAAPRLAMFYLVAPANYGAGTYSVTITPTTVSGAANTYVMEAAATALRGGSTVQPDYLQHPAPGALLAIINTNKVAATSIVSGSFGSDLTGARVAGPYAAGAVSCVLVESNNAAIGITLPASYNLVAAQQDGSVLGFGFSMGWRIAAVAFPGGTGSVTWSWNGAISVPSATGVVYFDVPAQPSPVMTYRAMMGVGR